MPTVIFDDNNPIQYPRVQTDTICPAPDSGANGDSAVLIIDQVTGETLTAIRATRTDGSSQLMPQGQSPMASGRTTAAT